MELMVRLSLTRISIFSGKVFCYSILFIANIKRSMLNQFTQQKKYYFFLILCAVFSVYLFFHVQFNGRFSYIFGDEYDSVIESFLVSHWFYVLSGERSWSNPLYFYPHEGVLGYNDAYFLYGLVASVYRLLGFNIFISQEFTHILFKIIGFFSMATLLNRLQSNKVVGVFGAMLFTLFISSSTAAYHGQLISLSLSPLLSLIIISCIHQYRQNKSHIRIFFTGCGFILLYSSWLMTSFYSAWFYGLFFIIFVVIYTLISLTSMQNLGLALKKIRLVLAGWILVGIFTLIPFLFTYLPKLLETGGQQYADQIFYSLNFSHLFYFGKGSLIWPDTISQLFINSSSLITREHEVGFTPDIFLLICATIFFTLKQYGEYASSALRALLFATVIGLLLPISVHGQSLWFLISNLIPGGSGVRVIARFYLFLTFPITILIAFFLKQCIDFFGQKKPLIYLLASFVILSQVNRQPYVHLNVDEQLSLIENAPTPPQECKSFFVKNPILTVNTNFDKLYRQNLQAMLLSDNWNLSTLNGFSTFNPPDWVFDRTPSYLERVGAYVDKHKLLQVCSYDIGAKQWELPQEITFKSSIPRYQLGYGVDFSDNGVDSQEYVRTLGWSTNEDWGTWSNMSQSLIIINLDSKQMNDLNLIFRSRAFLTSNHPRLKVDLEVNGQPLESWIYRYPYDLNDNDRIVRIPKNLLNSTGELILKFSYDSPISLSQLKIGGDRRLLGLGIVSLSIH